ncbi:MAG: molecular chaperone HtpG [Lachnospiraceae bacterium]|nr:molecular chaperone HtpG [Lachnospiraceae bacterium]
MAAKKGSLSINSENIFPIIKKWLYSDHDIFVRELISNGCDAITKLKKLEMMGEYEAPLDYKPRINVIVSPEKKTMTFTDNGLGMTADEVEEYINQIAFSGATDFIEKYKDKANDDQIIGHFGLGFYSAFMVSDRVTIDTLSYQKDAKPVHWECDGGTEFTMDEGDKAEVGTTITLYLNEDCLEFANEYRAREVLKKYCSFMPTEIYLYSEKQFKEEQEELAKKAEEASMEGSASEGEGWKEIDENDEAVKAEDEDSESGTKVSKAEEKKEEKPAKQPENDTDPLWTKNPSECEKDDYLKFYRKVFNDYKEPLFWIHLNMDYPFNLKGILYFPKINMEYESIEGTIKLYNNQVFIADNIKEVIPEFLLLLKGVIDCPDLQLNVSRSALQNDGFVKKISDYITKKVADKLSGMCKTQKDEYEKYWDDIAPFIKYGCLKDDKFCEKMNDYILFKNIDGVYMTLPECLETKPIDTDEEENTEKAADGEEKADNGADEAEKPDDAPEEESAENESDEKKEKIIYYVTDMKQQSQYVGMFRKAKMDAVVLTHQIDLPFINQLESKNEGVKFKRIDEDFGDALKAKTSAKAAEEMKAQEEELGKLFKKITKKENVTVKLEKLKNKEISSMITVSEESRRMEDMMKMYSMGGDMGAFGKEGQTLVLNANNKLVQYVLENKDGENVNTICEQLYDLALLQHAPLEPEAMAKFVARTNKIMLLLAE